MTVIHASTQKVLAAFKSVEPATSIRVLKERLCDSDKKFKFDRISFRLGPSMFNILIGIIFRFKNSLKRLSDLGYP